MSICIDELSKEEYIELIKFLNINKLRSPISPNKKLVTRYCKGFRPDNIPAHMIANLYFSEIRNGNRDLKKVFLECVDEFFEEETVSDLNEKLSSIHHSNDAVEIGFIIAERKIFLSIRIIAKLLKIDINEDDFVLIEKCFDKYMYQMNAYEKRIDQLEQQSQNYMQTIEQKNKEISKNQKKLSQNKDEISSLKKDKQRLQDDIESAQVLSKDLEVQLSEIRQDVEKKDRKLQGLDNDIKSLSRQVDYFKEKLEIELSQKKEIEKERDTLKKSRLLEYQETVVTLVKETILELGDGFSLSETDFNEIINTIEEPHTFSRVWDKISKENQQLVDDIEVSLKGKSIGIDIIDQCDIVENRILAKYMIVKAIKAVVFEHISYMEIKKTIGDNFKQQPIEN